jgi:hypothetical protein
MKEKDRRSKKFVAVSALRISTNEITFKGIQMIFQHKVTFKVNRGDSCSLTSSKKRVNHARTYFKNQFSA